jgi:hypothetical protein
MEDGAVAARQCDEVERIFDDMWETAGLLRTEVGMTDLPKVLAAHPSVLLLNSTTDILPVTNYLRAELGIWYDDVPRVLESFPTLLGVDVNDMRRVVDYLLEIEVSSEDLAKIFRAFPSLLTLDVETRMKPVVAFLSDIGVKNIGRFVTRLPPVLGYSIEEELRPKWDYLASVCQFHEFEIVRFPSYFSYPLEKVIMTRYEYLRKKLIPYHVLNVDTIVSCGDVEFATKVAEDTDNGYAFSLFVHERRRRRGRNGRNKRGDGNDQDGGRTNDDELMRPSPRVQEITKDEIAANSVDTGTHMRSTRETGEDDQGFDNGGTFQFCLQT